MKWLARFRRKRADPLAALREPPSEDEKVALAVERLELDKLDALRDGEHLMTPWSNVAFGTRGYTLYCLADLGLMRREMVRRMGDMCSVYTPTAAGRAYLAEREDA